MLQTLRRPRAALLAASLLTLSTFTGTAAAEGPAPAKANPASATTTCAALGDDGCYGYDFTDDVLNATGNDAMGALIRLRSPVVRRTLIRPRTQFVSEMLKSVELI